MIAAMFLRESGRYLFLVIMASCIMTSQQTVNIIGAGASFPLNVYTSWIPAFEMYRRQFKDVNMKYESIGSGGGKARIKNDVDYHIDYAGSDSPLSDEDYQTHPDLQMFPTMAGAVVCVFNLPTIAHINMTMQQVVGIYSGSITWWNDSSLVELNPNITLPNEKIIPIARREKSGTTEIFTRTLSSFDSNWKDNYGTFVRGLDEDDKPYHWNVTVVRMFGLTNRGMSGMIKSIRYSIGYLVMSEATTMKLHYCCLQNSAGYFIPPNTSTIQNAMTSTTNRLDVRMTASLSNPPGNTSYPMAGYTYLIIRKSNMSDCETAKELVRYIEWFFTNPMAISYCSDADMVPVHPSLYNLIFRNVLQRVTCNGQNVYDLVSAEAEAEAESLKTWKIPVYIAVPMVGFVFLCVAMYVIVIKTKTWREVLENNWKIERSEINFCDVSLPKRTIKPVKPLLKNKIRPAEEIEEFRPSTSVLSSQIGEWCGKLIFLKQLEMNRYLTFNKKKRIIWLMKTVQHKNVTLFYGLVHMNDMYHSVMDYNTKGSLSYFLQRSNLKTSIDLSFSISYEIVCGMKFLHRHNLVHGDLRSMNCYFDNNWLLKISDWECEELEPRIRKHVDHDNIENVTNWNDKEFWSAPELLQRNGVATKSSDVYSFGMIMQEIFSRELPFSEYSSCRTPGEVLEDIISIALRPGFASTTPFIARSIMESAWDSDAGARPSFSAIYEKFQKTFSRGNAVVDSIIHILEDYISELEEHTGKTEFTEKVVTCKQLNIGDKERDVSGIGMDVAMTPEGNIEPREYSSVSVVVCSVYDSTSLVTRFSSREITEALTKLFQALDDITQKQMMHRFELSSSCYKVVAGLSDCCISHAQTAAYAALEFLSVARTVFISPKKDETMRVKVGVCSGSLFAGCMKVGTNPDRRFLCGEALSVATILSDTAHTTTVLVSQSTEELLHSKFHTIPRLDPVAWKGAPLRTFWLIGNRNQFSTSRI